MRRWWQATEGIRYIMFITFMGLVFFVALVLYG